MQRRNREFLENKYLYFNQGVGLLDVKQQWNSEFYRQKTGRPTADNFAFPAGGIRRPHTAADWHTGVGVGVRERVVVIRNTTPRTPGKLDDLK